MIPNWLWRHDWVRSSDGYMSWGMIACCLAIIFLLGLLSAWVCLVLV